MAKVKVREYIDAFERCRRNLRETRKRKPHPQFLESATKQLICAERNLLYALSQVGHPVECYNTQTCNTHIYQAGATDSVIVTRISSANTTWVDEVVVPEVEDDGPASSTDELSIDIDDLMASMASTYHADRAPLVDAGRV
jgi:hypothetical protein